MAAELRPAADALVRHAWARLRTATAALRRQGALRLGRLGPLAPAARRAATRSSVWLQSAGGPGLSRFVQATRTAALGGATWFRGVGGPGLSQYVLAAPAAATGAALWLRHRLGPILHALARLALVGGARGAHLAGLALAALGSVGRSAGARASVARGGEDIGEATRVEIEAHDDLAAVRARLNQSAGAAVVLRARGGNSALASPLGMRLLRRHVDMTRLLVIIESRDGRLRRSARQHGMMIVPSMRGRRVEGGRLRAHRLGLGPIGIPIPLLGLAARAIVLASLIVVAGAAVLFLVPSTTVRLAPQLTPISVPISVIARVPAEGVPLGPGIIPARRYQATITVSDTIATTGFVEAPDAAARGVVRFQNRTAEAVELSPGTRATSGDGTIFFTLARVTLPAEAGSAVDAEVQAEEPGLGGNVAAGTVTQPDPLLGRRVTVTNPEPISGGTTRPARGVADADLDRWRAQREEVLRRRGWDELGEQVGGAVSLHRGSVEVHIDAEQFTPPLGEPAEAVEVVTIATVSAVGVEVAALRDLAVAEIGDRYGADFRVLRESLTPRAAGFATYDAATETIAFDMIADGQLAPVIAKGEIEGIVELRRSGSAEAVLNERLSLRAPAEVDINPSFMPWVSPFGFRISVEVDTGFDDDGGGASTPAGDTVAGDTVAGDTVAGDTVAGDEEGPP